MDPNQYTNKGSMVTIIESSESDSGVLEVLKLVKQLKMPTAILNLDDESMEEEIFEEFSRSEIKSEVNLNHFLHLHMTNMQKK